MGKKLRSGWEKIRLRLRWLWRKIHHPLTATGIIVMLIVLAAFALSVHSFGWDWTGFNGGYSKITTKNIIVNGKTADLEQAPAKTLWDWLQLGSGIIATLAIIAAGWWFYKSRSLAGTFQITLTLTGVTMFKDTRIAVVRVQIKNVGRTRVRKYYCISVAEAVKVRSYREYINIIPAGSLIDFQSQYSRKQKIFTSQTEIEPNEEMYEDVALVLNETTLFAVGVQLKGKGTQEAWSAYAIFNADESAKIPYTADHLAEHTVRLE